MSLLPKIYFRYIQPPPSVQQEMDYCTASQGAVLLDPSLYRDALHQLHLKWATHHLHEVPAAPKLCWLLTIKFQACWRLCSSHVNGCFQVMLTVVFQPGWQLCSSQVDSCVPAWLIVVFCYVDSCETVPAILTVVFQPCWQFCSSQVYSSVPDMLTVVFQPGW